MGTLTKAFVFTQNTPAVASQVNADLDVVYNWINGGQAVWADGSTAFTGIPLLPNSDPSSVNHASRKGYVDGKLAPLPAQANIKVAFGTATGVSNGSGMVFVTFGQAFPSFVGTVILCNGDATVDCVMAVNVASLTPSGFQFYIRNRVTGVGLSGVNARCNYVAFGG